MQAQPRDLVVFRLACLEPVDGSKAALTLIKVVQTQAIQPGQVAQVLRLPGVARQLRECAVGRAKGIITQRMV